MIMSGIGCFYCRRCMIKKQPEVETSNDHVYALIDDYEVHGDDYEIPNTPRPPSLPLPPKPILNTSNSASY